MEIIDTHAHLNFGAFEETWQEVADRARERGVVAVVMPGSQYPTSVRAVELARQRPGFLFAAVGLHPTHIHPSGVHASEIRNPKSQIRNKEEKFEDFDYERYLALARQPEVVAIGEVGLDTYRLPAIGDQKTAISDWVDEQERVLKKFIRIAQEVDKPLILHCRGARKPELGIMNYESGMTINPHERLIEILEAMSEKERPRFVVHCYQGTRDQAERYLALGGLISFTGTITYSDDLAVSGVVKAIPLDRLMVETDSPYLSPAPYRGEQNEPWKVLEVARRVAELKSLATELIVRQTTLNAKNFFGLPI